jgi:hypothetical protein
MSQIIEPEIPITYRKVAEGHWAACRGQLDQEHVVANLTRQNDGKWVLELTSDGHGMPKPLLAELEQARVWLNRSE